MSGTHLNSRMAVRATPHAQLGESELSTKHGDRPCQQAVCGEAVTGHRGKGNVSSTVVGLGC